MNHSALTNLVAWCLTVCGCAAFLVAGIGIVFALISPDQGPNSEVAASLHDTYYIIHRSRSVVWPLLLCATLSVAIAIVGYTLTTHYIVRTLQEQSSAPKT